MRTASALVLLLAGFVTSATSALAWTHLASDQRAVPGARVLPTPAGDVVASALRHVVALDAVDGTQRWRVPWAADEQIADVAVNAAGIVVAVGQRGGAISSRMRVTAFDGVTGTELCST